MKRHLRLVAPFQKTGRQCPRHAPVFRRPWVQVTMFIVLLATHLTVLQCRNYCDIFTSARLTNFPAISIIGLHIVASRETVIGISCPQRCWPLVVHVLKSHIKSRKGLIKAARRFLWSFIKRTCCWKSCHLLESKRSTFKSNNSWFSKATVADGYTWLSAKKVSVKDRMKGMCLKSR